jgi:hypothetical protein
MATRVKKAVLADGDEVSNVLASKRQEDVEFMSSFTKKFLRQLKNEPVKKIVGSKAYANYFGSTYTALFNTVPVTIKFDGTEQSYPESIANWLLDKIIRVTESNIPVSRNDRLSE